MSQFQLPYHFVSNDHPKSEILTPIVSHRLEDSKDKTLYSGEFHVELTCLTPFFTGNQHYIRVSDRLQPKPKDDSDHHTWIAPLTWPEVDLTRRSIEDLTQIQWDQHSFLISPDTLKGLYGNLIDKLTAAPMKRVKERGFHFRMLKPEWMKAGLLVQQGNQWKIQEAERFQFDEGKQAQKDSRTWKKAEYHHPNQPKGFANDYGSLSLKLSQSHYPIPESLINVWKNAWEYNRDLDFHLTAKSLNDLKQARIPELDRVIQALRPLTQSPENLIRTAFRKQIKEAIKDIVTEDVLVSWIAKKPGNKIDEKEMQKEIRKARRSIADQIVNVAEKKTVKLEKKPALKTGMVIFYRLNSQNKVAALSANLYLKWPYQHSVWNEFQFTPDKTPQRRKQLGYFREEALKTSKQLTPRQKLLGYVFDKNSRHPDTPQDQYLPAYAGRVHFNFAVCKPLSSQIQGPLTLKTLGSPKPSAYEFYVQPQPPESATPTLSDYGFWEDPQVAPLAGRKHYLHYPPVAEDLSVFQSQTQDNLNATVVGALVPDFKQSQPFPSFKFSVRFDKLEAYEVGMLQFVLNLSQGTKGQEIAGFLKEGKYTDLKELNVLAVKAGYARPLGLGSMLSQVRETQIHPVFPQEAKTELPQETQKQESFFHEQFDQKLRSWLDPHSKADLWNLARHTRELKQLLRFRVHEAYKNKTEPLFDYPREKEEIFKYHMEVHNHHIERRIKDQTTRSPFYSAEKIWEKVIEFQEWKTVRDQVESNTPSLSKTQTTPNTSSGNLQKTTNQTQKNASSKSQPPRKEDNPFGAFFKNKS
ncbi:MAG: hypothetical protein HQM12_20330 [SAR324 cluster bacterium]|nr:hypothetical protein [SAR324 cluster bacterium]